MGIEFREQGAARLVVACFLQSARARGHLVGGANPIPANPGKEVGPEGWAAAGGRLGCVEPVRLKGSKHSPRKEGRKMATAAQVRENIRMLLEAAEFLERREREAEHGYASMLPYSANDRDAFKRRNKSKKNSSNSRSTHNEMEKNRRAHLRLCLEKLKGLVPLGPESSRHTTLSLLTKAKLHIKKLEDCDRRAIHQIDQLQREQRHLRRQLEKLGIERIRTDSTGSAVSSERSDSDREEDVDVDVESTDDLAGELDWSSSSSSPSDSDERGSLQSLCSDEGYSSAGLQRIKPPDTLTACLGL
nr:PREDICTED: max dimerization protein 1 [Anolis carolinensis]|eukprot:XP_008120434.2 PREDICTED: max dimerization protein 1 [Anolis carolinensis]